MVQLIFTTISDLLDQFLGGYDGLLIALVTFTAINYITDIMCVIYNWNLPHGIDLRSICQKVMIFIMVGAANILDTRVIGSEHILRTAVVFFYLSHEGRSVLGNAGRLGLPVPRRIEVILTQFYSQSEDKENDFDEK